MSESWREISAQKQKERDSRIPANWRLSDSIIAGIQLDVRDIPSQCGILTLDELSITQNYDATDLLGRLHVGKLSSEDVVRAFCKRAAIAQQLCNCLTEIFFDEALARARELDEHLKKHGTPIGPLHGLPISLKDSFQVRGYDASLGVASLCGKPAETESALVQLLRSAGAVLYCKTNVPQTLSALDSHNNIFGRTLNPRNRLLTAGGSTGGEGALIGLRGSILGVGTDIGGSIRVPAYCNGIYGIKPSHGRVPYAGQAHPSVGKLLIDATAGPLATSLRDCELFLRAVSDSLPEHYDPEVISQSWMHQPRLSEQKPLLVGVARTDGHVVPLPPITRLIDTLCHAIQSSSQPIVLVDLDVSSILSRIVKTFNGIMSTDGGNIWFDQLAITNEPLSPWLQNRLARRAPKTAQQLQLLQVEQMALQADFAQVWHEHSGYWDVGPSPRQPSPGGRAAVLDAIVFPIAPHPIPPIDRWNSVNYTAALNLLDLPAGVIPVGKVTADDIATELSTTTKPLNGWDKVNRELWNNVDRQAAYLDMPLGIQVVTPRLTERKLLGVMARLEQAFPSLDESSTDRSRASRL